MPSVLHIERGDPLFQNPEWLPVTGRLVVSTVPATPLPPSRPRSTVDASRNLRCGRRWVVGPGVALVLGALLPAGARAERVDVASLVDALETIRIRDGIPGLSLALVDRSGTVFVGGKGIADRSDGRSVDADTLWRLGSITKLFTSTAMLIAARQHGFTLEAPVRSLVPDAPFDNPWCKTDPVRVGQLLEHTAGLLDMSKTEFEWSGPQPLPLAEAFAVDPGSRQVQWPPGRYSSYSNTGAGLASLVIERTTGRPYEAFVRDEVLRPLGLRDAGFERDAAVQARLARGYDRDGVTARPYWEVIYRAFGGLQASADDMARVVGWLLRPETVPLLTPAERDRLETPRTTLAAAGGLRYGYALGLYHYVHDGREWIGHGGDADGYLALVGYQSDAGVGYFLAINAFHPKAIAEMQRLVERALTRGEPLPPVADVRRDVDLAALAGCYVAHTRRSLWTQDADDAVLRIEVEGDHLVTVNPFAVRRAWYPVTARHFRRDAEPVATAAFADDPEGALAFAGDFGNMRRVPEAEAGRCE